jgi:NAD(P) transhydrogenase subunit alpha
MIVGVPKESYPGETRVALVPGSVQVLTRAGCEVLVERGAGAGAGHADAEYSEKQARVVGRDEVFARADVIVQVRAPGANPDGAAADLAAYRDGQIVIGHHDPLGSPERIADLAAQGVVALALELVPRITRAQGMDVLSSMATIAGYRSVLLAALHAPRLFPMLMTAAGTLTPAKVFVIGVGVAGLQAIATARRLGAVVQAYDVRPAVKEQVQSLGAKFVEFELETGDMEDAGGYAKEQSEEFLRRQQEAMARVLADSDVVITTAAVPGRRAPVLVTAAMVRRMAAGAVIVDIAAERGGNCELTRPGETVVENGVVILGPLNLPAAHPRHASQMYAKNITNFVTSLLKDGELVLDTDDEVVAGTLLCRGGEVVHPRVRELLGLATRAPGDEPPARQGESGGEEEGES